MILKRKIKVGFSDEMTFMQFLDLASKNISGQLKLEF